MGCEQFIGLGFSVSFAASVYASDGVSDRNESVQGVTGALHGSLFLSRQAVTRIRVFSWATARETMLRYFMALRTIQPPGTRSRRRPSLSGSEEFGSGEQRHLIAAIASSSVTRARWATFRVLANWANPVSSMAAKKVSQTILVGFDSSQIEESSILVKILEYMKRIVTARALHSQ